MSPIIKFFAADGMIKSLNFASESLQNGLARQEKNSLFLNASYVFKVMTNNTESFDKSCQYCIERYGNTFSSELSAVSKDSTPNQLQKLISLTHRFILEYDLSNDFDISQELSAFQNSVQIALPHLDPQIQETIRYSREEMPFRLTKSILNSNDFKLLRDASALSESTSTRIEGWTKELKEAEARVSAVQGILEKQTNAFNFVGLSKGFSDLEETLTTEMRIQSKWLLLFGLLMLCPSSIDLVLLYLNGATINSNILPWSAALAASISLTFLFVYFFRISLRNIDSCKTQLSQTRLRRTLCSFIQDYANYSNEIKSKNPDALTKFEALIFSGIVGIEEKMPSTFDGLEQLSGLIKSARSK